MDQSTKLALYPKPPTPHSGVSYHGVASSSTGSDKDEGIRGDIGYVSRGSAGVLFSKSRISFQSWRKPPMSDRGALKYKFAVRHAH